MTGEDGAHAVELPPDYYHANFLALLDNVAERYADLLKGEERAFLARFRGLDRDAQMLYVRLTSRVGPWFRLDKLNYPEIGDLPGAAAQGLRSGLLVGPEQGDLDELLG